MRGIPVICLLVFTCGTSFAWPFDSNIFQIWPALISGDRYYVPDNALFNSASYANLANHAAQCSRLDRPRAATCYTSAWISTGAAQEEWIQVDLGTIFEVFMVATKGRGFDTADQYVKTYKLASSQHFNTDVELYKDGHVFEGNTDKDTVVKNRLDPALEGRFILLIALTFNNVRALRWELYGRKKAV